MAKHKTFYSWLIAQVGRLDHVGDLAGDAKGDQTFKDCGDDLQKLHEYLASCNAIDEAKKALNQAFFEYREINRPTNLKARFLVIEYIPDRLEKIVDGKSMGVHTPLRQDGVYFGIDSARDIAECWVAEPMSSYSKIAIVEVIEMYQL